MHEEVGSERRYWSVCSRLACGGRLDARDEILYILEFPVTLSQFYMIDPIKELGVTS